MDEMFVLLGLIGFYQHATRPKPHIQVIPLPDSYRRGCHVFNYETMSRCDFFPINSIAERDNHIREAHPEVPHHAAP